MSPRLRCVRSDADYIVFVALESDIVESVIVESIVIEAESVAAGASISEEASSAFGAQAANSTTAARRARRFILVNLQIGEVVRSGATVSRVPH